MKLGMLSWSSINMRPYIFCPIWGRFWYMLLTNWSFSQQAWWFSAGNVPPLGTKQYPLPRIAFKFFSRVNIEQQECCVIFCDLLGFVWTFLCINWVFNAFMCIIQIWTTCTCSSAFPPQRWDIPYRKPSCLLWEAPVCEKHIPKPAPNETKFVPRHVDAAPL